MTSWPTKVPRPGRCLGALRIGLIGAALSLCGGCEKRPGPSNTALSYFGGGELATFAEELRGSAEPQRQAEALNKEGCAAWLKGDLELAARKFEAAAAADPSLLAAFLNLAAVLRASQGGEAAQVVLDQITNPPELAAIHAHHEAWLKWTESLRDQSAAAVALREVAQRDLDLAAVGSADFFFTTHSAFFARLVARGTVSPEEVEGLEQLGLPGRFIRAEVRRLTGDWTKADEDYRVLLELFPENGGLAARLAAVRFAQGDFRSAADLFARAAGLLHGGASEQAQLYAAIANSRIGAGAIDMKPTEDAWIDWQRKIATGSVGSWRIALRYGSASAPRRWGEWTDSWFARSQFEIISQGNSALVENAAHHGAPWLLSFTMAGGRL